MIVVSDYQDDGRLLPSEHFVLLHMMHGTFHFPEIKNMCIGMERF